MTWRLAAASRSSVVTLIALGCALGCLSPFASAQNPNRPKDEIFGGYSLLVPNGRGDLDYKINTIPNAFDISNTYYLRRVPNLGVLIDGSGHFLGGTTPPNLANGSNNTTAVGYMLFGLQYKFHLHSVSPFLRASIGGANLSPDCCGGSKWNFAVGGGGGVDLAINPRFSIRMAQVDYIYSNYNHSFPSTHPTQWNSIRFAVGVVLNIGNYGQQKTAKVPSVAGQPSAAPSSATGNTTVHATQSAAVESSLVPLDTLSSSFSTVITGNQLRNLPLLNRNFLALGLLASSTHDVPAWSELKDTTFSISGQRPTSNAFMIDGMDNVASSSNQAIPFQVNDAIQEFRVITATSDAQFGRNIGGVVNIVTRRGTAKFHGSMFGFFASDSIDASSPLSVYNGSGFDQAAAFAGPLNAPPDRNQYLNPSYSPIYQPNSYNQYVKTVNLLNTTYGSSNCTAPNATFGSPDCFQLFDPAAVLAQHNSHTQPLSSQQFGAQAGGSFLTRWYWFGDYEGTRINNPNPIFERVPSSYDRSHLAAFQGQPGYQDAAFAQAVLSLYPQSNVVAIPDVLEFYQGYAPNYTNVSNYLGRLDFTQSDRTDWTFRYNLQDLSQLHDDTLPSSSVYPGNGAQRAVLNQNLVGTFTHRFSDRFSNVARAGFTRFQVQETPQDANFNAAQAGLPSGPMQTYLLSGLDPQYAGALPGQTVLRGGWYDSVWFPPSSTPVITPSLDGLFPFARLGAPLSAPGKRQDTEVELVDNIVWFKGRHTVRAGIELRRLQNIFDNGGFSSGMVVSCDIGEFTSDSETCIICSVPRSAAFLRLRDKAAQFLQHHLSLLRNRGIRPGHVATEAELDNQPRPSLRVLFAADGSQPPDMELRSSG